ncbi:hypothetical protein D3C86_1093390 [compost metagenome]
MASGRTSAADNSRRSGNSNVVMSQAQTIPKNAVVAAVIPSSMKVRKPARGRTLARRCCHPSVLPVSASQKIARMGMAAMAATMMAAIGNSETRFVAGRGAVMGMRACCLAKALTG